MHMSYTDEQNIIRSMVREFAINECRADGCRAG